MNDNLDHERLANAKASFKRMIGYILVAGVLMVVGALYFLSVFDALTIHAVIATTAGVFVSVLLGAGLMAAGFFSSNSGHDERATGYGHEVRANDDKADTV